MNGIRYILLNPLGWGMALVHWGVVAFAFLGDLPTDPIGFGGHSATDLMFYLAVLDLPALLLTKLILSPFNPSVFITSPVSIIPISLITFQWLLIGAGLTKMYSDYRTRMPVVGEGGMKLR